MWRNAKLLLDQPLAFSVHRWQYGQYVFTAGTHAHRFVLQHTQRSTAIVIWRKTDISNPLRDKLGNYTWAVEDYSDHKRITTVDVLEIAQSIAVKSFSSRGQAWPIGATQRQLKVCSLFGCFANFTLKSETNAVYKLHDVDVEVTLLWERTPRGCVSLRFLRVATCSGLW